MKYRNSQNKASMNTARKKDMEITQGVVSRELKQFQAYFTDSKLQKMVFGSFAKKLSKVSVRAYFIQKIYEYIVQCSYEDNLQLNNSTTTVSFFKKLPFIVEAVITIEYEHNKILDSKYFVNNNQSISERLIGTDILKDKLYDYIEDNFDSSTASTVSKYVRRMFKYCAVGQYMDKIYNNYSAYQQNEFQIPTINSEIQDFLQLDFLQPTLQKIKKQIPHKSNFIHTYFQRIYLTSAALFILSTELVLELTDYNGQEKENILNFARAYGLMLQIVNDNSDFVVDSDMSIGKNRADYCKDIENRNITLPLMFYLSNKSKHHSQGIIKNYLESNNQPLDKETAFKEMIQTKSIFKSIEIGRLVATIGRNCLQLSKSQKTSEVSHLIKNLMGISENNKFYYHYYKARAYFKEGKKYHFLEHDSLYKKSISKPSFSQTFNAA